jgi:hypothetical protein
MKKSEKVTALREAIGVSGTAFMGIQSHPPQGQAQVKQNEGGGQRAPKGQGGLTGFESET